MKTLQILQIIIIILIRYVYSKTTIMVVLGCAVEKIQQERISTALTFANNIESNIIWFVTGGVKNALTNVNVEESEAKKMEKIISNNGNNKIVIDDKAKNTAENFAYLKKWVLNTFDEEEIPNIDIVITTSEFHKERASKIFNGVFETDATWNLSSTKDCIYCWNDEKTHMKNVAVDVKNALYILE